MGDHYFHQVEDKEIPAWDCLKPLDGFSPCVVSLRHHNHPHTQLGLQQDNNVRKINKYMIRNKIHYQ